MCRCVDSCALDPNERSFTRHDAILCFTWALPHVTDEIQNLSMLVYLSYVDFLEAIARICTFKRIPSKALIDEVLTAKGISIRMPRDATESSNARSDTLTPMFVRMLRVPIASAAPRTSP